MIYENYIYIYIIYDYIYHINNHIYNYGMKSFQYVINIHKISAFLNITNLIRQPHCYYHRSEPEFKIRSL